MVAFTTIMLIFRVLGHDVKVLNSLGSEGYINFKWKQ